jgi:hypothetical protein
LRIRSDRERYYVGKIDGDTALLKLLPTLNEAQVRWVVAREAVARGRGGISALHRLTGLSRPTITKGVHELEGRPRLNPEQRVRRIGGGRKRLEVSQPGWDRALKRLLDESTAGDPTSHLRWTHKSTVTLAEELQRQGFRVSDETVRQRLWELGYTLQANVKTLEGKSPPERDEQFRYINQQVQGFLDRGEPVLSIDAKKRENVGSFKNPGKTWRSKGLSRKVNVYDFVSLGLGVAIPYGTYDVGRNKGFVNVGISHQTAEFAVESLRRWWRWFGRKEYPKARRLLLCADNGGSTGPTKRAWKYRLQGLAQELGLEITVCHYPPGTSKWNRVEHRLFSFITLNWAGQPLVDYQTVLSLIRGTKTKAGLRVRARLDCHHYATGEKVTEREMQSVNLQQHEKFPDWNYTILPTPKSSPARSV